MGGVFSNARYEQLKLLVISDGAAPPTDQRAVLTGQAAHKHTNETITIS